jgi:hypothetical protein
MATIRNTWVEKIKKKKEHETAPSYERDPLADTYAHDAKKPKKRFSVPATSILVRTLRGIRK